MQGAGVYVPDNRSHPIPPEAMSTFKSIFLIDDDPDDQYFFTLALDQLESLTLYAVATNGKEALELLAKSDTLPDLIVMDMNMPQMNGLECLTALDENMHTRSIPVVILSTDTKKMEAALKIGAKACIKKSSNIDKLRTQLALLIRQFLP